MHYIPVPLSILTGLILFFVFVIFLIEIRILGYAYEKIGIERHYAYLLLFLSLVGGYINIPLYQLPPEKVMAGGTATWFGMNYIIPYVSEWPGAIIAVNLGGAVIPTMLSIYLIIRNRLFVSGFIGVLVMTVIIHMLAHPVRGVGIAVPTLLPPVAATLVAVLLSFRYAPALAYISGTLGTLIGADLLNLGRIQGLGAPVASIGGAGTYDGIFLTGILAVLLASLFVPGRVRKKA